MNSFGRIFRVSLFGESHGDSIGITVDGCPAGIPIIGEDFVVDLKRRSSGSLGTTTRRENDVPKIISGVFNGFSTGAPITILLENNDVKKADYELFRDHPRPSHTDYVCKEKYTGFHDYRGGGHLSARLTAPIVCAGVIARKVISPIGINAKLINAGGSEDIGQAIQTAMEKGESIGGIINCTITGLPTGLGEPFFDGLESVLSHAVFSIPAVKGIEFGSGFAIASMSGSVANDRIVTPDGHTSTNHSGGINGGISNGNDITFNVAMRPTPSIKVEQDTWNFALGRISPLKIQGRHDVCVALRAPVIVEAMSAITIADMILLQKGTVTNGGRNES